MSARRKTAKANNGPDWPKHRGVEADCRLALIGTVANGEVVIDGTAIQLNAARRVMEALPRNLGIDALKAAILAAPPIQTRRWQ
jgi:hypothetical protein